MRDLLDRLLAAVPDPAKQNGPRALGAEFLNCTSLELLHKNKSRRATKCQDDT